MWSGISGIIENDEEHKILLVASSRNYEYVRLFKQIDKIEKLALQKRILKCFDSFNDISEKDDESVFEISKKIGIDDIAKIIYQILN